MENPPKMEADFLLEWRNVSEDATRCEKNSSCFFEKKKKMSPWEGTFWTRLKKIA